MASVERGGYQPEEPGKPERESLPYYRAARFAHGRASAQTYQTLQDLVFASPADLSVYRVRRVTTNEIPAAGRRGTGG